MWISQYNPNLGQDVLLAQFPGYFLDWADNQYMYPDGGSSLLILFIVIGQGEKKKNYQTTKKLPKNYQKNPKNYLKDNPLKFFFFKASKILNAFHIITNYINRYVETM